MKASDYDWYHRIDLGNGEVTHPRYDLDDSWDLVRRVRKHIEYPDRRVIDVATFDGMWAFEAEKLGASEVVAIDMISLLEPRRFVRDALTKFLYARQCLNSSVLPYFDCSVHQLADALTVLGGFDIIQNLGLIYHQLDPVDALRQCRAIVKDDGVMLLETAYDPDLKGATVRFNRGATMFYPTDLTTYWAPSMECLELMLEASGWRISHSESIRQISIGRVALVCHPTPLPTDAKDTYRL